MKDERKHSSDKQELSSDISAGQSAREIQAKLRAELYKTATLVLVSLFAIVLGSVAWFVANSKVDSGGIMISHQYDTITLATKGERQTEEKGLLNLPEGEMLPYDEDDYDYYYTEDGTIALRLNSDNISVRPGLSGEVTFYIIPKHTGRLETTLYLELVGYQEYTENGVPKATRVKDDVLDALLEGHILLFQDEDYNEWLWTGDGSIIHISENAQEGVPLPVTFYWYWPLRYENMREVWLDRILSKPLPNTPNYRYNRIFIANAVGDIPQTLTDAKLCDEAYNRADEYIGSHADFLYLSIQASLVEAPIS